ncbi:MAG: ribosomal-protein-alanine N-acetyltransferase [Acidobacteria bacterium]|nr:MAG: ribosomal-protein-alanine N-acetyltransferase [Acidobacteriota bacterium]
MTVEPANDQRQLIRIEPMLRTHLDRVIEIECACFPRPWSKSLFLSELAMPATRAYFVANLGSEIVGFGGMMMAGDECHITNISVDPLWQGRGIAKHIVLAVIDEAITRGARSITLEVREGNVAGQRLYERFGFEAVGVRKNYYVETREDALVMWVRKVNRPAYRELLETIRSEIGDLSAGIN